MAQRLKTIDKDLSRLDSRNVVTNQTLNQTEIEKNIVEEQNAYLSSWKNRVSQYSTISSSASFSAGARIHNAQKVMPAHDKKRGKLSVLSRVGNAAREYAIIAGAAAVLEMVISFSLTSLEGLFLIGSTLAAGTSVLIIDK